MLVKQVVQIDITQALSTGILEDARCCLVAGREILQVHKKDLKRHSSLPQQSRNNNSTCRGTYCTNLLTNCSQSRTALFEENELLCIPDLLHVPNGKKWTLFSCSTHTQQSEAAGYSRTTLKAVKKQINQHDPLVKLRIHNILRRKDQEHQLNCML